MRFGFEAPPLVSQVANANPPKERLAMANSAYLRAFGIGAVAGLRTFTAPAATLGIDRQVWSGIVMVLAAGELIADKLPFTPSRLRPGPLGARLISGGLCGRALARRFEGSGSAGLILGALGAAGSAYAGYAVRRELTRRGLPDFLAALGEDSVAVFGAACAVELPEDG
jgi:uncharacterized membrane protein